MQAKTFEPRVIVDEPIDDEDNSPFKKAAEKAEIKIPKLNISEINNNENSTVFKVP